MELLLGARLETVREPVNFWRLDGSGVANMMPHLADLSQSGRFAAHGS